MTLTYRGISYPASSAIATPATETTATYRGQRYNLSQPLPAVRQHSRSETAKPASRMTYRGVAYGGCYSKIGNLIAFS